MLFFSACNTQNKQNQPESEQQTSENKYPSIMEIAFNSDTISLDKLMNVCQKYHIDSSSIYKWQNHVIIYDTLSTNYIQMMDDLAMAYPDGHSIKFYEAPYYVFDRKNCEDKSVASEWSHTIMTANLVNDSIMQKEYMDYHATQAENWPEIANGFCNANFQQLLMFRNDRQLMLIISIPKGENLDELNPKTTENNPRVDDWNAIMAKYQEGIEDADEGAVWVVFSPL